VWVLQGHASATRDTQGTRGYKAPEQDKGEAQRGQTDVWALGCVALVLW